MDYEPLCECEMCNFMKIRSLFYLFSALYLRHFFKFRLIYSFLICMYWYVEYNSVANTNFVKNGSFHPSLESELSVLEPSFFCCSVVVH